MSQITIWNRAEGREEAEQVYGDSAVRALYETKPGQWLAEGLLSKRPISSIYGAYQSSHLSRHKVAPFIEKFKIPMQEYEEGPFATFNDFFIRKFRAGARTFVTDPARMPAFCEARYFAWESISPDQVYPVKGKNLSAEALLGAEGDDTSNASRQYAREFHDGPLVIARLCPVDYHRFHYPDDGETLAHYRVGGALHSVNPLALKYRGDIFATNERQVSILKTKNFGLIAYIEVGALCVGKIVQTHPQKGPFSRGEEKGYFLFGGSTVIILGQKGAWKPDEDLLRETTNRREVLVRLGDGIARRV